jgi:hypothetical protein
VVVLIIRFLTACTNKGPWKCSKIRKQIPNQKKNVEVSMVLAITTRSQISETDALKEKEKVKQDCDKLVRGITTSKII